MMGYYGWGAGGWLLMAVAMTVFWGVVIVGIVLLVRFLSGRPNHHAQQWRQGPAGQQGTPPGPTAEDVLADRFARGEIDEAEYRQRLTVLREAR